MAKEFRKNLYIGPAGWSYPDWDGIVYPQKKPKNFSGLAYLAKYFDTIEVNSTFYRIPQKKSVIRWAQLVDVNPRFLFTLKVWQKFTHESTTVSEAELNSFKESIEPLKTLQKLGALLFQFPWRFKFEDKNSEYLQKLFKHFKDYPNVVEFRHESWNHPSALQLLSEKNIGFANIDQPVIGRSLPPTTHVTSRIGYVRLHGRNYKNWFKEDAGRDARYDYLYKENELLDWKDKIDNIADRAEKTFIIFNNHFRGQAVVNSLQLVAKLMEVKPLAPEQLIKYFPELKKCCRTDYTQENLSLF